MRCHVQVIPIASPFERELQRGWYIIIAAIAAVSIGINVDVKNLSFKKKKTFKFSINKKKTSKTLMEIVEENLDDSTMENL